MLDDGGIESLYFTSDNPKNNKDYGTTDSGRNHFTKQLFYYKSLITQHSSNYIYHVNLFSFSSYDSELQIRRR